MVEGCLVIQSPLRHRGLGIILNVRVFPRLEKLDGLFRLDDTAIVGVGGGAGLVP